MRLTPPMPLDPANVAINACDLAHQLVSIPNSSQLVTLRWGAVKNVDMLEHLTESYTHQIITGAKIPRIGAAEKDDLGNSIERREHLVIRDLDLLPSLVEQHPEDYDQDSDARKLGRIVAHADYRFRPAGGNWRDPGHAFPQANGSPLSMPQPPGANVKLIELFDEKVEELLDYHCKGHDCYELVNISTAATHLRKGLAKQLVVWIFPFCDEQQIDYKLVASPMGRGLYKNCGFVEEGKGDKYAVEIDMNEWGGEGLHQHVYMVRHPEKAQS